MMSGRWARMAVLAALALVLVAAGPSVGNRIADGQHPTAGVIAGPCADDSAVLVRAGDAEGVLFRCEGGVPVPRAGSWSTQDCDFAPESITLLASGAGAWPPATACLVGVSTYSVRVATPTTPTTGSPGR